MKRKRGIDVWILVAVLVIIFVSLYEQNKLKLQFIDYQCTYLDIEAVLSMQQYPVGWVTLLYEAATLTV